MNRKIKCTNSSLAEIGSLNDWTKIESDRYSELIGMLSLQDMPLTGERPPLNVRVTATQDVASSPDGRGAAIEILNCLRVTDVYQLPALLTPAEIIFTGEIPESYKWSENLLVRLGMKPFTRITNQ